MINKNKPILITGSSNPNEECPDPNCPICRLMKEKKEPTLEELEEAFKEAEKIPGSVVKKVGKDSG